MKFTGRSRSYAYKVLQKIRIAEGKEKHCLITIQEFADFQHIPVTEIEEVLFKKHHN